MYLADDSYHVQTTAHDNEDINAFQRFWFSNTKEYFKFKIKACSSARIAISERPKVTRARTFMVNIGGAHNNLISIVTYNSIGELASNYTRKFPVGVLKCDTLKEYWIDWTDRPNFSVGTGELRTTPLMTDYTHGNEFNVIGISTDNTDGQWEFARDSCEIYIQLRSFLSEKPPHYYKDLITEIYRSSY